MSIGKWVVVAFVLFAGFIGTLVTICVRQDISLVSKEYYKEELAYQEQIKRMNNAADLIRKPLVEVTQHAIRVTFDSTYNITQGQLSLFCPSNAAMDRKFAIEQTDYHQFTWALSGIKSGMYRVKLQWTMNNKDFYQEEIVNL